MGCTWFEQRAQLEQEAYDEKNKLLNQSQFQELLELQSDEEPDFVEEIVEMYITDAKEMLKVRGRGVAPPFSRWFHGILLCLGLI